MFDNLTPFEGRSYVDEGCSLSVMSYITFAVITVNTVVNINDVSIPLTSGGQWHKTFMAV